MFLHFKYFDESAYDVVDVMFRVKYAVKVLNGDICNWEEFNPGEEFVCRMSDFSIQIFTHVRNEVEVYFDWYGKDEDQSENFATLAVIMESVFEDAAYIYRGLWRSVRFNDLNPQSLRCIEEAEYMKIWKDRIVPALELL